jgi:hypothetical protein
VGIALADAVADLPRAPHGRRAARTCGTRVHDQRVVGAQDVRRERAEMLSRASMRMGLGEGEVGEGGRGEGDVGVLGLQGLHVGGEGRVVVEEAGGLVWFEGGAVG